MWICQPLRPRRLADPHSLQLLSTFTHTCAVEPLVPYVDNIHEVIKKPFLAKGPQQFAMKACNSSNLCYSVVVCARRQELQPPPVPSLAARDTITQLLPHGPPGQHTATIPDHTTHVPPVPYVDNIHEVIKKPFVAKGPQQFAMKACNSTSLCYCSSSTSIPGGRS